jgi:FkbM family methyltransferase
MLIKLKKIPSYFRNLIKKILDEDGIRLKDVIHILKYVEYKQIIHCLHYRAFKQDFVFNVRNHSKYNSLDQLNKCFGRNIKPFLNLLRYRKKILANGLCQWSYKNRSFYANYIQMCGLLDEYLSGAFDQHYACNWRGKNVLDIGGFIGDSALYFLENGANKVVIYEPLELNVKALFLNLDPYKHQIEVYQEAISHQKGPFMISSNEDVGSLGFGMVDGHYQVECEGVTFQQLFQKHAVDVVKIDCEGGEKHLVDVPNCILSNIPYWIIETHSPEIYQIIHSKFKECGFIKLKEIQLNPSVTLMHFATPNGNNNVLNNNQ